MSKKVRHLMRIANLYRAEHPGCLHLGDGSFLHAEACATERTRK